MLCLERSRNANPLDSGSRDGWNRTVVEFPAWEQPIDINVEICRPFGKGTGDSLLVDDVSLRKLE